MSHFDVMFGPFEFGKVAKSHKFCVKTISDLIFTKVQDVLPNLQVRNCCSRLGFRV
jgi:hypothetical protein